MIEINYKIQNLLDKLDIELVIENQSFGYGGSFNWRTRKIFISPNRFKVYSIFNNIPFMVAFHTTILHELGHCEQYYNEKSLIPAKYGTDEQYCYNIERDAWLKAIEYSKNYNLEISINLANSLLETYSKHARSYIEHQPIFFISEVKHEKSTKKS